ncbi:hypothetical protein LJ739_16875 [Aestuariibacter halophilus]|uniref:histidine kinase n=1 Tax=Fluctibacter halophilus TaxID=226011 RepID=A0ABS8GBZ0_9ALTE|nr:cache domain-containing protein [Aestuariibacter halophilus]MCC2617929.1 hypothetical protein [Aestuariibacter halophilus]
MQVSPKALYSLAFFLFLTICVGLLLKQSLGFLQEAESRKVSDLYQGFVAEIQNKGDSALTVAATISSMPLYIDAVIRGDRAYLRRELSDTWTMLNQRFNVRQFQFHAPDADSFLRLHSPDEYGDSLADFRFTVVQSQNTNQPVVGLEKGVYGVGIRGVEPLTDPVSKQNVGSVEIGFAVDETFLEGFRQRRGADVALYLLRDGQLQPYISTWEGASIDEQALAHAIVEPVQWLTEQEEVHYRLYADRLEDFSGKVIGAVVVRMDRQFYQQSKNNAWWLASGTLIAALTITVLLNLSLVKLQRKAKVVAQKDVELKQSQQAKQSMLAYIVEKEKMASLGQIVFGVAHEINTPLGVAITANSCLLSSTAEIEKKYTDGLLSKSCLKEYLRYTEESGGLVDKNLKRLSNLIHDFKLLAVNKQAGEEQVFSLAEAIHSAVYSLQDALDRNNVTLSIDIPEGLMIKGSSLEFMNIARHAVTNALQHGMVEGKGGQVDISARVEADQLVLSFQDDGMGIDAEALEHIFEPFYTTARSKQCTGLGLSIIYNVVMQKYQGRVDVRSPVSEQRGFNISIFLTIAQLPSEQRRYYTLCDAGAEAKSIQQG